MPKYKFRKKATNKNILYKEKFEDRGVTKIEHFRTKNFENYLNDEDVSYVTHTWSTGDRYYKLSYHYYETYEFWWVIALFNNKPTEAHLEFGDVIKIPTNPEFLVSGV